MRRLTNAPASFDNVGHMVIEDLCAPSILEHFLREAEPFLKRAAAHIAEDFPAARSDLVQEARIALWQLDLSRFSQRDVLYLRRILCNRMIDVYKTECLEGLTTGWSRHADRGTRRTKRKTTVIPEATRKAA